MDFPTRLLVGIYPLWARTLRYRVRMPDLPRPGIYLLWHGRIFPALWWFRNRGIRVLVSPHRDGRRAAMLLRRMGYHPLWGSAARGAVRGTRAVWRALREGHSVAITPDGPAGPPRQVKLGLIPLILRARVPLLLVGAAARPARLLGSWDRFLLPYPFAQVALVGRLFLPRAPFTPEALNRALDEVEEKAEALLG